MMFGKKKCNGCGEEINENSYDCVVFKIMRIRRSRDHIGPQRVREQHGIIRLHQGCLAKHIWMVRPYAMQHELADVEVVRDIHRLKSKFQIVTKDANSWGFRVDKEGGFMKNYRGFVLNNDVDKLFRRIVTMRDLCFIVFTRNNIFSPPVLCMMDDPLIASQTSSQEYKEKMDKLINEYKAQCAKIEKTEKKKKENVLSAGHACLFKLAIYIPA